jgi:hypothetical protein
VLRPHLSRPLIALLLAACTLLTACIKPAAETGPPDVSRPTLTAAATALEKRDKAAFLETLSGALRQGIAEHLDLSGSGPAQLAKVIRDAKLVAEYPMVRIYESTLDHEKVTFTAIKEGDKWLLTGL